MVLYESIDGQLSAYLEPVKVNLNNLLKLYKEEEETLYNDSIADNEVVEKISTNLNYVQKTMKRRSTFSEFNKGNTNLKVYKLDSFLLDNGDDKGGKVFFPHLVILNDLEIYMLIPSIDLLGPSELLLYDKDFVSKCKSVKFEGLYNNILKNALKYRYSTDAEYIEKHGLNNEFYDNYAEDITNAHGTLKSVYDGVSIYLEEVLEDFEVSASLIMEPLLLPFPRQSELLSTTNSIDELLIIIEDMISRYPNY